MSVVFACAKGLASSLDARLLGSYDGAGAWQVFVSELGSGEEQLFVEMHEGMHHELQASTGWGLVSAMASELALRKYRPGPLRSVFWRMVERSRTVHEMFATAISSFVVGPERAEELLLDNMLYSTYLRAAEALVPRAQAPSANFHHAAVIAVLRAVMCPESALRLLDVGYAHMTPDDLESETNTPDARIAVYRDSAAATAWQPLLASIAAEHPEHLGSFRKGHDDDMDENHPAFQARRIFEEEVLLPACYRHVENALNDAGFPTIRFGAQSDLAAHVKGAVHAVDPELAARLRVVTERRPVADDGLEYDRQQLVLRDRLPAVLELDTGSSADRAFLSWNGRNAASMLGIWVSAAAARKQWSFTDEDSTALPPILRALLQVGSDREAGTPLVVIAKVEGNPAQVQRSIGDHTPLLVVTTHSSLVNTELTTELGRVEPVFVVMDLPVARHTASWIEQGLEVRMAASPLTGTSTDLWVLAFTIAEAPAYVFLSLGGAAGVSLLIERLRRSHGDALLVDADVLQRHSAELNLVVAKILATWHVLDQDGIENRGHG